MVGRPKGLFFMRSVRVATDEWSRAASTATANAPSAAPESLTRPGGAVAAREALLGLQRRYGNRQSRSVIQAKLRVGPAGDRFERAADRVAEQALAAPTRQDPEIAQRDSAVVQRVAGAGSAVGASADPAVEQAVRQARGGGRPVPRGVRDRMERATGADFGPVRVHVDTEADQLNLALGAKAFTVGQDVFVRRSEYRPGSAQGDRLLAHELTHTVQQGAVGGGSGSTAMGTVQRYIDIDSTDEAYPEKGTDTPPGVKVGYFPYQVEVEAQDYTAGKSYRTWLRGGSLFKNNPSNFNLLRVNLRQGYKPGLRFSNDFDLAVQNTKGAEAKVFYATEEQIERSNARLKGQVQLVKTARFLEMYLEEVPDSDSDMDDEPAQITQKLYQVEALQKPPPAKKPNTMAGKLRGALSRKKGATEAEPQTLGLPTGLNIRTPQDCERMSEFVTGADSNLLSFAWFDVLGKVLDHVHTRLTGVLPPTGPYTGKQKTSTDLPALGDEMVSVLKQLRSTYGAQLTAALQAAFAARQLNEYLTNIDVGSQLAVVALGKWEEVADPFAYHYGGVVAASGDDFVTMENYARRDPNVRSATSAGNDPLHFFYMYSTSAGQESWHSRWVVDLKSFAGFPISFAR
ncbi:eCIS core domain-containing protein [Solwaraspora sp. WMMB335]|uniref:eCIS core domain-containing protein n=1 Tax=Solwaraspora sp. WMMB335 TaxID=3404118 RepID=UPI003B95410D